MEFNGKKAKIAFTIKAVESIPCEVRGQTVAFDENGVRITDLEAPWPMPWIEREMGNLVNDETMMPEENSFRIYNPDEPDQYVHVEIQRF